VPKSAHTVSETRQETRTCHSYGKVGHLAKHSPSKSIPKAAVDISGPKDAADVKRSYTARFQLVVDSASENELEYVKLAYV
jgi:hypothetical protein